MSLKYHAWPVCNGLGMTLGTFFDTEEFDRLEQEIK